MNEGSSFVQAVYTAQIIFGALVIYIFGGIVLSRIAARRLDREYSLAMGIVLAWLSTEMGRIWWKVQRYVADWGYESLSNWMVQSDLAPTLIAGLSMVGAMYHLRSVWGFRHFYLITATVFLGVLVEWWVAR